MPLARFSGKGLTVIIIYIIMKYTMKILYDIQYIICFVNVQFVQIICIKQFFTISKYIYLYINILHELYWHL